MEIQQLMHIALYQPDIPQNTGTILRMAACLGLTVDIIGPAGFDLSDRALKRAGLDYLSRASFRLFMDFDEFVTQRIKTEAMQLVLATTRADKSHIEHHFAENEIIVMGRESAGVPDHVHKMAHCRIKIPMKADTRSLNLALSSAIIIGEALRQTGGFPQSAERKQK